NRRGVSNMLGTLHGGRETRGPAVRPDGRVRPPGHWHAVTPWSPISLPLRADREVGLDRDTLLDQRSRAAVLRHHHDSGRGIRRTVHVVGHVEGSGIGHRGATVAAHAAVTSVAVAAPAIAAGSIAASATVTRG